MSIDERIETIFELYEKYGEEEYHGEEVSQIEHMCQSGELARKGGYDEEVILAAFFHDIGHLLQSYDQESMGGYGRVNHEKKGGEYLRNMGFSEKVASLAEQHVNAKRYLTYSDKEYYNRLSDASKKTLEYQGGPMQAIEAAAFKAHPWFELNITMRLWDELAKEKYVPLPDMNIYKMIARHHLEKMQSMPSQIVDIAPVPHTSP